MDAAASPPAYADPATDSPSPSPGSIYDPDPEIIALQAERKKNSLAIRVARQRQQLRSLGPASPIEPPRLGSPSRDILESAFNYWDPSNFVNLMDYVGNGPYGYSLVNSPWLSTRADRDFGRDRPIFQTEMDLWAYQGAARLLATYNANAVGALATMTSYVCGTGPSYEAHAEPNSGVDAESSKPVVKAVQAVIDRFIKDNKWLALGKEKFERAHVDGEFFEGLWHVGGGAVEVRLIEPQQITQPYAHAEIEHWIGGDNHRVDWTFGVCADADDAQNVHGYYAQWTNRDTDWDFLPGGKSPLYPPGSTNSWCEHFKVNTPRNVKRGLTDFISMQELFNLARKIQINMGTATSIASAIAWIMKHAPGMLAAQVSSMIQKDATSAYTQGVSSQVSGTNSRINYVKQYNGGTILHAPKGQDYENGPGAENAPNFIDVEEAMLRSAAVRWGMPDHMITGSADEVNYAAILETGSPFVKRCQGWQTDHAEHDTAVLWKVVRWNCEAGVLPWDFATVQRLVKIEVEPPRVDIRKDTEETQRNEILKKNGVLCRKTWAQREGLDFEQEEANGAKDEMQTLVDAKAQGGGPGNGGGDIRVPGTAPPAAPSFARSSAAGSPTESPIAESLQERSAALLTEAIDTVFGEAGIYP